MVILCMVCILHFCILHCTAYNTAYYTAYKIAYDKKSDEGSNSVRMRPENSGASKVVEN